MPWFKKELEKIISELKTDIEMGLSSTEVEERLHRFGKNQFDEAKKETLIEKILHHLKDTSTIILLIAVVISTYMAITTGSGWPKVFVILSIVLINIVLGITQESKAEKALDALKELHSHNVTVIRDGTLMHIDADILVPGDILELNSGDMISADARIISSNSLQVEESPLTGESLPVEKDPDAVIEEDAPLGDRINMVYSGCLVTNGRAKAVVVETGMKTEMGKIAGLLNSTKKLMTPLQKRLKSLAKRLCFVAVMAGIAIFLIGVLIHGETIGDMLLISISLSVAAVPETLPVIVTLILAFGVQHMVDKKTIVRRIPAVETVGNTSVICSDKTGTLTQNKMFIQKIWHIDEEPNKTGHTFTDNEQQLLELLTACTNATIERNGDEEKVVGDPTEVSIIRLLHDKGLTRAEIEMKYPRVHELPFDSTRKRMTTVHKVDGGYIAITKGAFDRIPVSFDEALLDKATTVHDGFAKDALRVIAVGYKKYDELPEDLSAENLEHDINFLGLIGMIDPPRPESKRAVLEAKKAGIKTVMITGDHIVTASAIAKDIGILEEGNQAVSGAQLSHMSEEELRKNIRNISVYARVSPEDKIRIVQAWQSHGEVITMTGDGVNDAPALKAADVGAAMGITGTEVSKNAADMVITDDNFATIVDAIGEGRRAYENIRKTIHYLLSVNFAEILIMLIGVAVGWGAPIIAVQLLFINVVADGIPGFFISREKPDNDIMERKPLRKDDSIFAAGLGKRIAEKATIFIIITLIGFYIGQFVEISKDVQASYEVGITMSFIILSWSSVINIFNVKSNESIFKVGFLSNPILFYSAIASILITFLVAIIPPIASIFSLLPLSIYHWLLAVALASIQLIFGEVQKFFRKNN
ncbi:MAG: cation-translocating P-type ATPase [Coprobacillaceae bacterium]